MGLLRKAAGASPSKGPAKKGTEGQTEEAAAGPVLTQAEVDELFARSRPAASTEPPATESAAPIAPAAPGPARSAAPPAPSPQDVAAAVVSRINAAPPNSRFPSLVFAVIREALSVTKGALLLYDPARLVYAPWASIGYDTTTLRRLRIPAAAADSLAAGGAAGPREVSGEAGVAAYQRYFSNREIGLISRIILVPFFSEGALDAILLVTETGSPLPPGWLLACAAAVCREASPAVHRVTEARQKARLAPAVSGELRGVAEELPLILGSPLFEGRSALLVSISLKEYLDAVVASDPFADPFRLEEELHMLVGCFASDLGRVIQTGPGSFLLVLQDVQREDLDLFQHQLLSFLRAQFGEPDGGVRLRKPVIGRTRSFPVEESDIPALVTFFTD